MEEVRKKIKNKKDHQTGLYKTKHKKTGNERLPSSQKCHGQRQTANWRARCWTTEDRGWWCPVSYKSVWQSFLWRQLHLFYPSYVPAHTVMRQEDSFGESTLSFCHVGTGDQTEVIGLGGRKPCPLTHLSWIKIFFFIEACKGSS